jgi:hypothetical protein
MLQRKVKANDMQMMLLVKHNDLIATQTTTGHCQKLRFCRMVSSKLERKKEIQPNPKRKATIYSNKSTNSEKRLKKERN